MNKNQIFRMTIDDMASDGNGVGHVNGFAVFVPNSAVGDVADIKIVKAQKNYAFGIIEQLISPSDSRIKNNCIAYPQCGGCCFRHITYEAELRAKHSFVQEALRRIGGLSIEVAPVMTAPATERYRNKVQFPVCINNDMFGFGFFANRSHRIIPVADCVLQSETMNTIAQYCCDLFAQHNATVYNESSRSGLLRHIFLRRSEQGKVMLCFVINGNGLPDEKRFVDAVTAAFPEIVTIVLNRNTKDTNVILGTQNRILYGDGYLYDTLCGVPVRLSPQSFFQVNHSAATLLYQKIAQLADVDANDTVLDLYCGAGTIGLSLASGCKQLIGVEVVPQAIEDARYNAGQMGATNCEFIAADAGQAAEMLLARKQHIDIAITDPPRKGCGQAAINALISLSPSRIVMVSCNPATLARDLKQLAQSGYSPSVAYPVDLFPRTKHVETVVLMSRNEEMI